MFTLLSFTTSQKLELDGLEVGAQDTDQSTNFQNVSEIDKKVTSKAPKKARQEDEDSEPSDADIQAIAARKKEIESVLIDSPKRESNVESMSPPKQVDPGSDTDTDVSKSVVKPGPKRKKAGTAAI